jgi:hypothetical protein
LDESLKTLGLLPFSGVTRTICARTADSFYPESSKGKEIVDDGKMLFIWKKIDGAWKIVAILVSSDLPSK